MPQFAPSPQLAARCLSLLVAIGLLGSCGSSSGPGSSDLPELAYLEASVGAPTLNRIVLVRADGGGRRLLLEEPVGDVHYGLPQFTPQGDALLYYREASQPPAPLSGWWLVPINGGQQQPFAAPAGAGSPIFAPVGDLVAWYGNDASGPFIGVAQRGSTSLTRVIPDTMRPARIDWSPDGTRLVVTLYSDAQPDHNLFLASPTGGPLVPLVTNENSWENRPVWSPDGALIAYVRQDAVDCLANCGLWVTAPDGSNNRRVLDGPLTDQPIIWTPSSEEILVTRQIPAPGPTVRGYLNVATGGFRPITISGSLVEDGISSDGRYLLLTARSAVNEPAVVVTEE